MLTEVRRTACCGHEAFDEVGGVGDHGRLVATSDHLTVPLKGLASTMISETLPLTLYCRGSGRHNNREVKIRKYTVGPVDVKHARHPCKSDHRAHICTSMHIFVEAQKI